ncbi:hypothetical protein J6590_019017 [Homalodisca vitripennis]|nr:hypothetical protein J6590_019017 [Homalodisca vitripennis]
MSDSGAVYRSLTDGNLTVSLEVGGQRAASSIRSCLPLLDRWEPHSLPRGRRPACCQLNSKMSDSGTVYRSLTDWNLSVSLEVGGQRAASSIVRCLIAELSTAP